MILIGTDASRPIYIYYNNIIRTYIYIYHESQVVQSVDGDQISFALTPSDTL